MKKILQKTIAMITIAAVMFVQTTPHVIAQEATPTAAPTPTQAAQPTQEPSPTTPLQASPTPTQQQPLTREEQIAKEREARDAQKKAAEETWRAAYDASKSSSSALASSGTNGSTTINSAPATSGNAVVNSGNINAIPMSPATVGAGASNGAVVNSGNGAGSTNTGSSATITNNDTTQTNSATVHADLNQSAKTGDNNALFNIGNSVLQTQNANVSGTSVTAVNTNLDRLTISEFTIADDHMGDIVLDQAAFVANCISGCGFGSPSVINTSNGSFSNNNADVTSQTNNNTFQNNDASVGNNIILSANTGNNSSSFNTGGNTTIQTGNANVNANSLTFANNNIAGNVTFGVVNIYGNLTGDIILPEFSSAPGVQNGAPVVNANNGAGSNNTASSNNTTTNNTFQGNDVTINNELILNGSTGKNNTSYNTNGNATVKTGSTNVDTNILNIANTNITGGNYWLIFINEAGRWIGKLIGSPDGSTMAASSGLELRTGPDGQITATNNGVTNSGNGAGSTNNASASNTNNNTTNQTNNGVINNIMNLTANTGGNNTNFNTGGNNTILTGDANIIANMINFVNNNIVGGGVLRVLFINVFGSWTGDLVPPGQKKQAKNESSKQNTDTTSKTTTAVQNTTPEKTDQEVKKTAENDQKVVSMGSGNIAADRNITFSKNANRDNINMGAPGSQVAGAKTLNQPLVAQASNEQEIAKKKLTLNLAWLVLVIPLVGFLLIGKNIIVRRFTP